ncbi:MAG: SRPBCC domain-containing protein, partial [Chlorobium limicola]|nr:SRPBCC domain-containing protein [Chlorobium limicola]
MGNVRTEIAISARSADVWRVLFDTAVYPLWNPLVTAVRGL